MNRRLRSFILNSMLAAGLALMAGQAWPDAALERIESLIEQGKLNEALTLTNESLAGDGANVNYLFLKGLILTRQEKLDAAKEIFIMLTEQHPELPEPFNNLAVIYAAQGDFTSARQALQKAINTHPSYATAHENLGDIYAKMASRAYNQALELDQDNETAREKLLLVGDLFSAQASRQELDTGASNQEAERMESEVSRQERALRDAERKTEEELNRIELLRQDLKDLQAERTRAESDMQQANAGVEAARDDLAMLEQQIRKYSEQAELAQKEAAEQSRKIQAEITELTNELNQAIERRDRVLTQAGTESEQAERQAREARAAVQQARMELAGLEERRKEITNSIEREQAQADADIDRVRNELAQLQAEKARLERERGEVLAQLESRRQDLGSGDSELSRLQQASPDRERQSRQAAAITGAGGAETAVASRETPAMLNERSLVNAVYSWAEKWAAKDVDGYLSAYSDDFRPAGGISRAVWAAQRRDRIMKPRYIRVNLGNLKVRFIGDQHAQVIFSQNYQSDTYNDKVEKTLLMKLKDSRWLIAEETSD